MTAVNYICDTRISCPICGNSDHFDTVNNRENARCRVCLSMERTRLLYLILQKMEIIKAGIRVLHIAPEAGLRHRLYQILGDNYHACDFDIERYDNKISPLYPIDLCHDIQRFPSNIFDVIIHNHVIEHLPVPLAGVFWHLQRILKPGGHHFFTIPIVKGWTTEDINESDPQVRTQRFLQHDHYRLFGTEDTVSLIKQWTNYNDPTINVRNFLSEYEVVNAGIPINEAYSDIGPMTPFLVRK